jgi:hypothetical protein
MYGLEFTLMRLAGLTKNKFPIVDRSKVNSRIIPNVVG